MRSHTPPSSRIGSSPVSSSESAAARQGQRLPEDSVRRELAHRHSSRRATAGLQRSSAVCPHVSAPLRLLLLMFSDPDQVFLRPCSRTLHSTGTAHFVQFLSSSQTNYRLPVFFSLHALCHLALLQLPTPGYSGPYPPAARCMLSLDLNIQIDRDPCIRTANTWHTLLETTLPSSPPPSFPRPALKRTSSAPYTPNTDIPPGADRHTQTTRPPCAPNSIPSSH